MQNNTTKYYYKIYGLNIESDIKIPELYVLDNKEDSNINVKITIGYMQESINSAKERGIFEGFKKQEMWFCIKDIATYYIKNGNEIIVEPYLDINDHYIKTFILGTSFGLLLIQRGVIAIHGGAIVINDKAIICTGDSGAGKSTLTSALRLKGYKFLADDVSALYINDDIKAYPAYPQQKLCGDAVRKLGQDTHNLIKIDEGRDKYAIPSIDMFIDKPKELNIIFELTVADIEEVHITELKGSEKMNVILKNIYRGFINEKVGLDREYFKRFLTLVKSVQAYRITRPKDKFSVEQQISLIEDLIEKLN